MQSRNLTGLSLDAQADKLRHMETILTGAAGVSVQVDRISKCVWVTVNGLPILTATNVQQIDSYEVECGDSTFTASANPIKRQHTMAQRAAAIAQGYHDAGYKGAKPCGGMFAELAKEILALDE